MPRHRSRPVPHGLQPLVRRLASGGVVAFPTDTVCGLGCRATSVRGVRTIFALKGRSFRKPLILLVDSPAAAERVAGPLPPRVRFVLARLWPGAFTAILRPRRRLPGGVGTVRSVGVRVPRHAALRRLLRAAGPLATTSANRADEPPVAQAAEAGRLWPGRVGVLPGRAGRTPSTVADLIRWPPRIVRPGAISAGKLHRIAGRARRLQPR